MAKTVSFLNRLWNALKHLWTNPRPCGKPWCYCQLRQHIRNRRALAWLHKWMSTPDEMGEEWWADFDRELRAGRYGVDPDFLAMVERSVERNDRALRELARLDREEKSAK